MIFVVSLPHSLVLGVTCKRMVLEMWKILLFLVLLSADAQQLKFNKILPNDSVAEDGEAREDEISYRLPNNTTPELYILSLSFGNFHNDELFYTGNVSIVIRVLEDTRTITLHSAVMVDDVILKNSDTREVLSDYGFDHRREFLIITTEELLVKNSIVILDILYTAVIHTETKGIFRGSYQHDGEQR